jgi:PST family polysaccharide transporter
MLSPDSFGLIAMVGAFSFLFQNFGMRGFTEATIQSQVIDNEKISTLFWTHIGLSLVLTLLFIALAPVISWFYGEPRLKLITVAFSLTILLSPLSTQHLALLARNMQFYRISANNILATTTSTIMAIVLAWQGWGYWALVAKWVTLPLASAIGAWLLCQWRPGRPALSTGVRPMLTFAANTYGSFLLNYLSRNLDKVLIGWRYGSQSLGYYEKAYSFFVMPFNQLSSPLSNVVVSAFSRLRDDPERGEDN